MAVVSSLVASGLLGWCWLRMLQLVAAAYGYGCCLAALDAAPAVADGWGRLGVRRGQLFQ